MTIKRTSGALASVGPGAGVALLALGMLWAAPALAEPDVTGQWVLDTGAKAKMRAQDLPLTPMALDRANAAAARNASGRLQSEGHIKCLPDGMPHMMAAPFAIELLQTKGRITIMAEVSNLPRTIYLQETSHPADLDPSWNGHSIGHWEGEKLIVDTIGFNDRYANLFNAAAQIQRTRNLHIKEVLYTTENGSFLVDDMTLDDPTVFTKPFTITYRYRRLPPESEVMESVCEVDLQLLTQFEADQSAKAVKSAP